MNPLEKLGLPSVEADLVRLEALLAESVIFGDAYLDSVTTHLIYAGGKRLRPLLAVASATGGERPATSEDLLGGVAVECVSSLIRFDALLPLSGANYLKPFGTDQLQALSMLLLNLGNSGNMVSVLFYGAWLFPLGYLVLKSSMIPRILGILLIVDGGCLLVCFFQLWLFPGHEKLTYPLYPVMFIAEFGFALWLLIKGVKDGDQASVAQPDGLS